MGWDAEPGNLIIYVYHLKAVAAKNNYQVRIVDSWSAYDWIGPGTSGRITHAIQNSKIDEGVSSLLKLAILIENGGIMIGNLDSISISGNFEWIENMFGKGGKGEVYTCDPSQA